MFDLIRSIVKCVRDPTGFHSDKLQKALKEGDTKTVARIILGKNQVIIKLYRKQPINSWKRYIKQTYCWGREIEFT